MDGWEGGEGGYKLKTNLTKSSYSCTIDYRLGPDYVRVFNKYRLETMDNGLCSSSIDYIMQTYRL